MDDPLARLARQAAELLGFVVSDDTGNMLELAAPEGGFPKMVYKHRLADQLGAIEALSQAARDRVRLGLVGLGPIVSDHLDAEIVATAKTCATCRWWEADATGYSMPASWGYCTLAATSGGERNQASQAFAMDEESFNAQLVTAPDFGCVQWERKE